MLFMSLSLFLSLSFSVSLLVSLSHSIGWLRLLHHCLTHVSDLEAMMASAAAPTANLLQTCAALLMSPYCGMHSPNIEAVLVKIGLQSTRIGLKLIDILLRNCAASGTDLASKDPPTYYITSISTNQKPLNQWISIFDVKGPSIIHNNI